MTWKHIFDVLNEMVRKLDSYDECWVYSDEEFDEMADVIRFARELAVKHFEDVCNEQE